MNIKSYTKRNRLRCDVNLDVESKCVRDLLLLITHLKKKMDPIFVYCVWFILDINMNLVGKHIKK